MVSKTAAAATAMKTTLLKPYSIKTFRNLIQDNMAEWQEAPILLLTSELAPSSSSSSSSSNGTGAFLSSVSESTKLIQFTLGQQFNMRTVPATVSSAFPTLQDLESKKELLRRTGASSIVAVGSGAAMDLAKALAVENNDMELQQQQQQQQQLILIPSTCGAIVAAGASHSLFLDSVEETLVPIPFYNDDHATTTTTTTVAPLESKYFASLNPSHILYSSLAILLDTCIRNEKNLEDPLVVDLLTQVNDLLSTTTAAATDDDHPSSSSSPILSHEVAIQLLYQSSQYISYGLDNNNNNNNNNNSLDDRSIPMALSASLIPRIFPHAHILLFWANLVPALCDELDLSNNNNNKNRHLCKALVETVRQHSLDGLDPLQVKDETLQGFSVPDMALSHIQSNQTVWKSFDAPTATLLRVLEKSIATS